MSFGIDDLSNLLSNNDGGSEQETLKKDVLNCKSAVTLVLGEVLRAIPSLSSTDATPKLPEHVDTSDAAGMLRHLQEVSSKGESGELSRMCALLETLLQTVTSLEERWSAQDSKIEKLQMVTNDNEQYLMNYNLLWKGLLIPYHLNGLDFSQNIVDQINVALPYLNPPLTVYDIDISHPIMFNESPGIIVRFVRRDVRNNIYFQRKYLGNNISVFEHLTGPNKSLLREAREAVGEQNAWSCKGKLFISTAGRKKQFKCSQDIVKFSKPPISQSNSGSTPAAGNSDGKPSSGSETTSPSLW